MAKSTGSSRTWANWFGAAMRADAMLKVGDLDSYAVWKRILRAVEELRRAEPGARVH